jgi:hypothetical protein
MDTVLDLVVFGPAGLAITAAEEFPRMAEKGRRRIEGQVRTARFAGQLAVRLGRRQVEGTMRRFGTRGTRATPAMPGRPAPEAATTAGADPSPVLSAVHRADARVSERRPVVGVPPVDPNGARAAQHLAIPGYDSLSASQVVQRLEGLTRPELEDVRAHESAHRHRRTILNRVDQLLAGVLGDQP